jgi:hypothetical protein
MTWRARSSATEPAAEQLARLVDDHERFTRTVAEVRACLGGEFGRWVALGLTLGEATRPGRTAVRAYCAIAPARVARLGLDALARWVGAAVALAHDSRQLAETFADTTAPLLGALDADALAAWADAGRGLHRDADLRRSVLAHAFFASAPRALPFLAPAHYARWVRLVTSLRGALDPTEALRALPATVGSWSVDERTAWLDASLVLAGAAPAVAAAFYRHLPDALGPLSRGARSVLLPALHRAAGHAAPAELQALVPVAGALLPPDEDALALVAGVAGAFPAGLPALWSRATTPTPAARTSPSNHAPACACCIPPPRRSRWRRWRASSVGSSTC